MFLLILTLFSEYLATFLIGEGKLESFLEEYPPVDVNISKARTGLTEAKRFLQNTASEPGKKVSKKYFHNMRIINLYLKYRTMSYEVVPQGDTPNMIAQRYLLYLKKTNYYCC